MHLIGRNRVVGLTEAIPREWVTHFVAELRHANFKRDTDIRLHFPKSVRLADGTFSFPIAGHHSSIHVAFSFRAAAAIILGVRSSQ